ncbi:cytochrome P450 94A1-like [Helianthus annuus]|uniref:cytochrome P450 94A1-like n=1 Tax=Helianthus annuus TaxID=4232 RepID=UPI000B8F6BE0|nr:cytochrome P450 94A1-like [Helianthus annuus]
MDEYLEMKARQAKIRAKLECKDQGDEAISKRLEFLLTKVKLMEDYAQVLSKEKTDQRKAIRKELIAYIMKEKFYPAEESQFEEWPIVALKHEANRIERIKGDPSKKKTAPNWNKYKKLIADLTSEYKKRKQELVDAKVDTADAIAKCHVVDKETRIILSFYSMGRMEGLWGDDCMEFKPERWFSKGVNGIGIKHEPSYKFPAFHAGPRTCLGKEMGMI